MAAPKRAAQSRRSGAVTQTDERAKPARPTSGAASGRLRAPLLDNAGKSSKNVTLEEAVFAADVKPHLVHETVRSELNAARAATRGGKSRGLVAGGRSKPWRQKGTGRARQGTIRAPQFTGGGLAFPPGNRNFEVKVNRKARRAALRGALSAHAGRGSLGVIGDDAFDEPSAKTASGLLDAWGKDRPVIVVAQSDQTVIQKSFRNIDRVLVLTPDELEVSAVVWARSLLVSEGALEAVNGRASA